MISYNCAHFFSIIGIQEGFPLTGSCIVLWEVFRLQLLSFLYPLFKLARKIINSLSLNGAEEKVHVMVWKGVKYVFVSVSEFYTSLM